MVIHEKASHGWKPKRPNAHFGKIKAEVGKRSILFRKQVREIPEHVVGIIHGIEYPRPPHKSFQNIALGNGHKRIFAVRNMMRDCVTTNRENRIDTYIASDSEGRTAGGEIEF